MLFKKGPEWWPSLFISDHKSSLSDSCSRVSQRDKKRGLEQNLNSEHYDWRSAIRFGRSAWYFVQNPSCSMSTSRYHHRYQCGLLFQVLEPAGPEEAVQPHQKSNGPWPKKTSKWGEQNQWEGGLKEAQRHKIDKTCQPWKQRPWGTWTQWSRRCLLHMAEETEQVDEMDPCWLYGAGPRYGGQPMERAWRCLFHSLIRGLWSGLCQ